MMLVIAIVCAALHGGDLLVAPDALSGLQNTLVVDVRSDDLYASGHIPGAAHVDVETLSETRDGVRGLLKPVDEVRRLLADAGVTPEKQVVVYAAANDVKSATRAFWVLEYLGYPAVSVLDGGYQGWIAAGGQPATGASDVTAIPVTALPKDVRPELLASKAEVKGGGCALVDLRSGDEFSGVSKKEFVEKSGHIPGATSLPAGDLIQEDASRFKPTGAIAELLKHEGAGKDDRVVTYCNTGRDATVGYFAYRLDGYDEVAVYDGSMAEWAKGEEVAAGNE